MATRREVPIEPADDDGAVLYVEHYIGADGAPADDATATHYVGEFRNAGGDTVRKEWGKVTRPATPATS